MLWLVEASTVEEMLVECHSRLLDCIAVARRMIPSRHELDQVLRAAYALDGMFHVLEEELRGSTPHDSESLVQHSPIPPAGGHREDDRDRSHRSQRHGDRGPA